MDNNPMYLVEAIDQYGGYAVLLAVVLLIFTYIVYSNNKYQKRLQDELMKSSESYEKAFIATTQKMLEQILNEKKEKETNDSEPDLMITFEKLRSSLQDYCRDTMSITKADRLAIYLFHNGTHSTHGIKFFKVSCICENVRIGSGIREHSIDHNNIPLNLFDTMIKQLSNDGKFIILNSDDLKDKNYRIFVSADKIKYAIAAAIFDSNNILLGFVLSEFSNDYSINLASEQYDQLQTLIAQVSPILSYSGYIDTNIQITKN